MRITSVAAPLICTIALLGCVSPEQQQAIQEQENRIVQTIPVCDGEKDCAAKWDAAQLWVSKNARYKIQTSNNVIIETYNSQHRALAASVTKEPMGGGKYKIIAKLWCAYEDPFTQCNPDRIQSTLDFNRQIGAIKP